MFESSVNPQGIETIYTQKEVIYLTAGWKLKSGEILSRQVSNDKLWSVFNYVFSGSKKRNTYKFGLIKALLDNLFNMTLQGEDGVRI